MLSPHAKSEWMTIIAIGVLLSATAVMAGLWWLSIPILIVTICLVLFFRDPDRPIPTQRGIMVAPADGKVSSIHEVEFFEPFNGPATCIRIFLSVFDVHVNRSPIHGVVISVTHKPGEHLNVLNPESAEVNESNLIILVHPVRRDVIAAIRQVAGLCARTICCTANTGAVVQRGQRIGIIKLGSTTELYIPTRFNPQVTVEPGQYVYGGSTILANINLGPTREGEEAPPEAPPEDSPEYMDVSTDHSANPTQSDSEQSEPDKASETATVTTGVVTAATLLPEELPAEEPPAGDTPQRSATDITEDAVNLDEDEDPSDDQDNLATDEMDAIDEEEKTYADDPDAEELEEISPSDDQEDGDEEGTGVEDESEEEDEAADDDDDDDEPEVEEEEIRDIPGRKPRDKKSDDQDGPLLF